MSANSKIEWTTRTWNVVTGCDRISPGCGLPRPGSDDQATGQTGGCYALALAKRLKAMGSAKYQTDGDPRTSGPGFGVAVHETALTDPLRWRKPSTVFVNSMSDLWHARVPRDFIVRVFAVMAATPQHTYQCLTKRPERMARMLRTPGFEDEVDTAMGEFTHSGIDEWPLRNVWLGTSIELAEHVGRADHLRRTPAARRFISAEPLLGPLLGLDLTDISWLICGGESGPGARPMQLAWTRGLRDQCEAAGVPFFFKQWGAWVPPSQMPADTFMTWDVDNGTSAYDHDQPWRVGKKAAGRELDGILHSAFPAEAVTSR